MQFDLFYRCKKRNSENKPKNYLRLLFVEKNKRNTTNAISFEEVDYEQTLVQPYNDIPMVHR
jgi:hypothetical protein